ncbi:MAG TPA: adenylate/guanylate cyclase domain-containing protein [Gaiellaceae bacterium]|nr:adenylate/guanylate cyclase domain-containing protein [Gaiellaceae bacterium]
MTVCPSCGQENPSGFRFCGACGAALVAPVVREERKVVTALFCDLVGFTSRAERLDPEDVRALVAPYWEHVRSELERYGGTVEKFIGDAVMALFGAPIAHEDDPERAVRAALAIRDWAREQEDVQVRIGVATGEALVSVGADAGRGEGMASGDVVNTAARIQAAAPVNGVVVGETTRRATERAIEYAEREPVVAKGKAEPVRVWEPLQARSRLGVDVVQQSRTPLVGRRRELTALHDALARAHEGRTVQLVTLVGVPGIGKSRLVYELALAQRELVTWRQGRSLPYGEGVAMWALGEMVKAEAGVFEGDGGDETDAKLHASVGELLAGEDAAWIERHLRALVGSGGGAASASREEAFSAWCEYLQALAERRATVLVFEDLHWADDSLLDFVDHLVDFAGDVPLLVVATARPELLDRRPGWGGGKRNAATLSLDPLDADETTALARELVDWSALPPPTRAAVLERAEGNPLYAEQFLRALLERLDADAAGLPETVQGIIAARLDGLPDEEKQLLQDAAVLGKVFWAGALEAVGGIARAEAEALLHSLVRKEFVRRERRPSLAGESEWSFRHVLTRDVAYGQIPRGARAEKHRAAAEWIAALGRPDDHAEMLAHHYRAALEYARASGRVLPEIEDPARLALRDAGERAYALNAFAPAARYLEDALALWPDGDPERPRLLLRLALARYAAGEPAPEDALEQARGALLAAGDEEGAAEAEARLSELWWHRGRREVAHAHLQRARELVAGAPASAAKARVLSEVARYQMLAGEGREALEAGAEALAIAEELGLQELQAHALDNIGTAKLNHGDKSGVQDLERSIEIALSVRSPEAARGYNNLAASTDDFARATELFREAVRVGERLGNPRVVDYSRFQLMQNLFSAGEWDEYVPFVEAYLERCDAGEARYQEPYARTTRAMVRAACGDEAGALADVRRSVELGRAAADPQVYLTSLADAIYVLVDLGALEEARALASELAGALDSQHGRPWMVYTAALVAERVALTEPLRVLALQASDESGEKLRGLLDGRLAEVAALEEADGRRVRAGRIHLAAAERLVAEGRHTEADGHIEAALAFYRSVGATRYVERLEALLAATA